MVRSIRDSFTEERGVREVTLRYDRNNENDMRVLEKIFECLREQPRCDNCENYQSEGYFCGYESHRCKIHGDLEWYDHPYHDGDGSKCPDYKRMEGV